MMGTAATCQRRLTATSRSAIATMRSYRDVRWAAWRASASIARQQARWRTSPAPPNNSSSSSTAITAVGVKLRTKPTKRATSAWITHHSVRVTSSLRGMLVGAMPLVRSAAHNGSGPPAMMRKRATPTRCSSNESRGAKLNVPSPLCTRSNHKRPRNELSIHSRWPCEAS